MLADAHAAAAAPRRTSVAGLAALFGAIYFIQSAGDPTAGLIAQPVRSLLDDRGLSPAAIATTMALLALPWSLKPLLALLADFVPLFGSRRRSYFVASTSLAALGLAAAYLVPPEGGELWLLVTLLLLPTFGIAFTDVLADAVMIEVGKPRGLTGRLQSVQWFAAALGLIASGSVAGYLAAHDRQTLSFLLCAALWTASLALALAFVRDPPITERPLSAAEQLRAAARVPGLSAICAVSFVWECNPLSGSVNYVHMTQALGIGDQAFGHASSLFWAGAMGATIGYGVYCKRFTTAALLHGAIAAGVLGNVLYWWVADTASLYVVSTLVGFVYMTGSLILLDLAARIVPLPVAATAFAVIMALASFGSSVGEYAGGQLFEVVASAQGPVTAYRTALAAGVAMIASCWLWVPRLLRELATGAR